MGSIIEIHMKYIIYTLHTIYKSVGHILSNFGNRKLVGFHLGKCSKKIIGKLFIVTKIRKV